MAQHLLHGLDIHAVLQHQGRCRVAQLVGGVVGAVQPRLQQMPLHQRMDHGAADASVLLGEEQGVLVPAGDGSPHRQILLQSRLTRLIEVDDADLVALAQHVEGLSLNVTAVQADQLGDSQTAVEKQR